MYYVFFFNSVTFVFQTLFQDLFLVMANYTHNAFTEYLLMYSVCVQMYYKNPAFHKLALRVFFFLEALKFSTPASDFLTLQD